MMLVPLLNPKFAIRLAALTCELRVRGTSPRQVTWLAETHVPASIFLVVVCSLDTTLVRAIPQFTNYGHREEAQPALLVRREGLIEWLPRSSELS